MVNVKSVPANIVDIFEKYDEEIQSLNIPIHLKNEKKDENVEQTEQRKIFILDCYISRLRSTIFLSDVIIEKLTKDNPDLLKEVLEKINQEQE
jgi:hypothetical protein